MRGKDTNTNGGLQLQYRPRLSSYLFISRTVPYYIYIQSQTVRTSQNWSGQSVVSIQSSSVPYFISMFGRLRYVPLAPSSRISGAIASLSLLCSVWGGMCGFVNLWMHSGMCTRTAIFSQSVFSELSFQISRL